MPAVLAANAQGDRVQAPWPLPPEPRGPSPGEHLQKTTRGLRHTARQDQTARYFKKKTTFILQSSSDQCDLLLSEENKSDLEMIVLWSWLFYFILFYFILFYFILF